MTRKEFDWVGINLSNPGFSNTDFKDNGVNILNTSIGPEEAYINNPLIRNSLLFLTNGKFDQHKFHETYVQLAQTYNDLANDTFDLDLKSLGRVFGEHNIFVSPEERRLSSTTYMTLMDNPDHISYGITGIDKAGPRTKSAMELAESLPIYDSISGTFTKESPEESFFKNFWKPMMLATYDTDVDINGNPTTDPAKVAHVKGERKLNEDGEYYFEFVNGRSTYGKELLSKWNILTKEDSILNKYDPFDSDDISKSWQGSMMRNAIKVLPLLYAPVAPYYAAASITINLVDALGTLGKLITGSQNSTLNNITAFAESFNLTVSEEGMQKTFGAENVINMVGDTFMFLKSQNILARYAPRLFMEKVPTTPEEQSAAIKKIAEDYVAAQEGAIRKKLAAIPGAIDPAKATMLLLAEIKTAQRAALPMALSMVNAEIENFHKLGKQISTSMMAVTFGLHTYGEAKAQDVGDVAATALTLGAIAGQYALLSSHIGQKIFPEATIQKQLIKKALQELLQPTDLEGDLAKTTAALAKETTKQGRVVKTMDLMRKGKALADKIWGVNGTVAGTVAASTIATSIEMTSFTALDDVIASIYNLGAWISGDTNRMSAWENMAGRYGSSLLGGAIAGAIAAPEIYDAALKIRNMLSPQALEIIAHLINEGKAEEVRKIIRKNTWANPYLSTKKIAEREFSNGEIRDIYGTATPSDNLNLEAQQRMLETIDGMEKILTTYGAKIDSNSLLNVMVNGKNITHDIRYALLKDSNIAQMYLKEFVKNQVDIYVYAKQISLDAKDRAQTGKTDEKVREIKEEEKQLEKKNKEQNNSNNLQNTENLQETEPVSEDTQNDLNAKEKLREALKKNAKYMSGLMAEEFIGLAIFEMQPGINKPYKDAAFREYVEKNSVAKSYDKATLLEKRELLKLYEAENTGEAGVDNLRMAYNLFIKTIDASKDVLKDIHMKDNTPEMLSLKDMVEDVKLFMRRELFWSHSNPYSSPYELNSLEAPEAITRKSFVDNAADKIWVDRLTVINNLRKKYLNLNLEINKAIDKLLVLHEAIIEYRKFIRETKALVDASKTKFEDYKVRRDKAIKEGTEFTEEAPEVMEFNSETILNELAKARTLRQTLGPGYEESFSEIISNILEKIQSKLNSDAFTPELKKQLNGLYQSFVNPEMFYDENYVNDGLVNGFRLIPNTVRTLENIIEGLHLKTVGLPFIEELLKATENKAGFIDLETKNILNQVLDILKTTATKKRAVFALFQSDIKPLDEKLRFNLLLALGLMDNEYINVANIVKRVDSEITEDSVLGQFYDTAQYAQTNLKNYNSNGLLKVADTMMLKLKFSKDSITKILETLDTLIKNLTDTDISMMNQVRTNIKEFILSPTMILDMNNAILILLMIRSAYVAADGEVRDSLNSIGFNPTWNKIKNLTGDDALPVLKSLHVVEEVQDILDIIYKLLYWKEVAANAMKMRTELTDLVDLGLEINRFSLVSAKVLGLRDSEGASGWKGIDEFETAINNLSHLKAMQEAKTQDRITNLSDETKELIQKETINFEIALHKFLKANNDFIKDPKKLSEFINPKRFNIEHGNEFTALSLEDKLDDDVALIWYIASVGALDPEIYYSNLKQSLGGKKLPVAIQNMWKYQASAFVFFREYIDNFANAMVESYKKLTPNIDSSDLELKKKAQLELFETFIGTTINPHRRNIFLVESGAGSGKTDGYLPELIALLFKLDPKLDLNKDFWIAGPEDLLGREKPEDPPGSRKDLPAVKIRTAIGSKTAKTFTRDTLMKHILADFVEYDNKYKVINGKLQVKGSDNKDVVFDVDVNTGKIKFDYKLNDSLSELPKIIILDEISDYSTLDLDVIQDFALKHNIRVLASGDFTQSGVYGSVKVRVGDKIYDSVLRAGSCEFVRTIKSLQSFRTTNTQSDNNNDKIRVYFEKLLNYTRSKGLSADPTMPNVLELSHHFDSSTGNLYGTYVSSDDSGSLTETLKKYIDGIYQSIQNDPNKTVTLLYSDENSQIYKYINGHTGSYDWTTKTQFRKGTVLKGVESEYYIIDLNPDIPELGLAGAKNEEEVNHFWDERERVIRELYTALTRLKQGAILIPRWGSKLDKFGIKGQTSDEDTREISMSANFIEKRVQSRINLLGEMFPNIKPLEVAVPDPVISPVVAQSNNEDSELELEPVLQGFGTENNYKVEEGLEYLYNDVDSDRSYVNRRAAEENNNEPPIVYLKSDRKIKYLSTFEAESAESKEKAEEKSEILDEGCIGILHTFAAHRTGFKNLSGGIVQLDVKNRRDGAHGLYYCMNKTSRTVEGLRGQYVDINNITPDEVERTQTVLTRLATIAKSNDNEEVLRLFKKILGLSGESGIYMRYAFTSSLPYDTTNHKRSDYLNVDYDNELSFGGKGIGYENNKISRKELQLIIGQDNGDAQEILFTLPIAVLPHYRTMIHNSPKLFTSNIGLYLTREEAKIRTITDKKARGKASAELDEEMYKLLKADANSTNPTEGSAFVLKLLEIWRNTTEFIKFLDGDFLLATTKNRKGFMNLGPFLLTDKRGQNYAMDGYELNLTDSSRANMYKVHSLKDLMQDMDVTRVYTAKSEENFRYSITSGFTIKSGGYYVLIAPKGEFRESNGAIKEGDMFRYYQQLINDPEHTPIKVKLLNVRPPKSNVDKFMESEYVQLFESPDPNTRVRQNIGNLFTAYRILQTIFADYEQEGSSDLNKAVQSLLTLTQGDRVRVDDVLTNVLRLTYLECLKNPERKQTLDKIYNKAERELSDTLKEELRKRVEDNPQEYDYVGLLNALMSERSVVKHTIRNSFRYFLLYLWKADEIGLASIGGHENIKEFITNELNKYSILYNPIYVEADRGRVDYTIDAKYEENELSHRFTFYRTETDDIAGRNNNERYEYYGKDFEYAAEVIQGPLYGDLTYLVNTILQGLGRILDLSSETSTRFSPNSGDLYWLNKGDAKDHSADNPIEYFDINKKDLIDEYINSHSRLALNDKTSPYIGLKLGENRNTTYLVIDKSELGVNPSEIENTEGISFAETERRGLIKNARNLSTDKHRVMRATISGEDRFFLFTKNSNNTWSIRELTTDSNQGPRLVIAPTRPQGESIIRRGPTFPSDLPWDPSTNPTTIVNNNGYTVYDTRVEQNGLTLIRQYTPELHRIDHYLTSLNNETTILFTKFTDNMPSIFRIMQGELIVREINGPNAEVEYENILLALNSDMFKEKVLESINLREELRQRTQSLTVFDLDNLKNSTDEKDLNLYELVSSLGFSNIEFTAQNLLDASLDRDAIVVTLNDILNKRVSDLPESFIEDFNRVSEDKLIKEISLTDEQPRQFSPFDDIFKDDCNSVPF